MASSAFMLLVEERSLVYFVLGVLVYRQGFVVATFVFVLLITDFGITWKHFQVFASPKFFR